MITMDFGISSPAQRRGDRIHQERHVVVDDLDHRVLGGPAIILEGGVIGPHLGLAVEPLLGELPMGQRRAEQVGAAARHNIGGRHTVVIPLKKGRDGRAIFRARRSLASATSPLISSCFCSSALRVIWTILLCCGRKGHRWPCPPARAIRHGRGGVQNTGVLPFDIPGDRQNQTKDMGKSPADR